MRSVTNLPRVLERRLKIGEYVTSLFVSTDSLFFLKEFFTFDESTFDRERGYHQKRQTDSCYETECW